MAPFLVPILLLLLALALLIRAARRPALRALPPGPKGLPLLGNLFQVPSTLLWVKLIEWSKVYGPIYSYTLLWQPIIVLTRLRDASALLDRLSAKTSDRPRLIKLSEHMCRGRQFGVIPRNDLWKRYRRAAHESLNVRAAQNYWRMQEEEARILLDGLINHPEIEAAKHLQRESSSIAWRALFGHMTIPLEGPDPSEPMEEFIHESFRAVVPGSSIVDVFPFLNLLITRSKVLRSESDKFYEKAAAFFTESFSEPQVEGAFSLSRTMKETGKRIGMDTPLDCGWLAGALFLAAQDTTATALKWFLLAMILYPETAAPARAELERVVGDRPPSFADMDRLPQIEAMVKELLRWRPPVAGGIVHMATEDIIYEEYLIPKGAMLLPIAWSICHDPSVYPNGDTFDPSRFVDTAGNVKSPLPHTHEDYLAFGHGRRICIGKSLAINSLLISIAHLLWAFDFRKGVDEHGVEVTPDPMAFLDNGATVFPKPFPVKFVPRIPGLAERLKAVPSK